MGNDDRITRLENDINNMRRELLVLKLSGLGLKQSTIETVLKLELDSSEPVETVVVETTKPIKISAAKPQLVAVKTVDDLDSKVIELLEDGPKQRGEITKLSGGTVSAVQNTLNKLRKNGYVKLVGDKSKAVWHLVEDEEVAS